MMPMVLGTADFMVHHIHAMTIHITVLILLKGVLFARSLHTFEGDKQRVHLRR
jgi:photosystem I P700 chlorophyll a apoprotein A1